MATKAGCLKCAQLARDLASATFEVAAIQKDILQRDQSITLPEDTAKLRDARRVAREAIDAATEHNLSHATGHWY
jgi:hypothetical protein